MKRRLLDKTNNKLIKSIILMFMIVSFSLAFSILVNAEDITTYVKIEMNETQSVKTGTIRYVNQSTKYGAQYFYNSYWGDNVHDAGQQCNLASQSMALSYIGINRLPAAMKVGGSVAENIAGSGAIIDNPSSVSAGVDRMISGNGKYSPVIIYSGNYPSYSSSYQHWVIVVGRVAGTSNQYYVCDPAYGIKMAAYYTVAINGNILTSYNKNATIAGFYQLYNPRGNIDTEKPTISDVYVKDVSDTGYTIHCIVRDNDSLSTVKFPTWTENNGQDDLKWNENTINGKSWEFNYRINIADHNNEQNGWYYTDIYCYDSAGNEQTYKTVSVFLDTIAPSITNVRIYNCTEEGYTVSCTVSDNYMLDHIVAETRLCDTDIQYPKIETKSISGTFVENITFIVKTSDHNNILGRYNTIITVYDTNGNSTDVWANASVGEKKWIPDATIQYKGHRYELYNTTYMRWNTAKAYCDSIGGYLVCINSEEEERIIEKLLESGNRDYYWTGATDQYVEGDWTWITSQEMSYKNWDNLKSNKNTKANYGIIERLHGRWSAAPEKVVDTNNEGVYGFICEYGSNEASISDIELSNIIEEGYTINFSVLSEGAKISKVVVQTFTPDNDADDLVTYVYDSFNDNSADLSYRVKIEDHNYDKGRYATEIILYTTDGKRISSNWINGSIGGDCWKPTETIEVNGHKYALYDMKFMSWISAKTFCESLGGHLVTITSKEEQDLVTKLMEKGTSDAYWVGSLNKSKEGGWEWVTGEKFDYINWNSTSPSGRKLSNFGVINKLDGGWSDVPDKVVDENGNGQYAFICEYEKKITYSIRYELDGGVNNTDNPDYYYADNPYVKLSDPSKEGYIFDGWYLSETGGEAVTETTKLQGDIDLYARWKKDYVPTLSVTQENEKLIASISNTESVTGYGFVYGKQTDITLETPGRTRIAYSDLDSNGSYSFDATKLTGCTIRAYAVYTDENGNAQVIYSDPI